MHAIQRREGVHATFFYQFISFRLKGKVISTDGRIWQNGHRILC